MYNLEKQDLYKNWKRKDVNPGQTRNNYVVETLRKFLFTKNLKHDKKTKKRRPSNQTILDEMGTINFTSENLQKNNIKRNTWTY